MGERREWAMERLGVEGLDQGGSQSGRRKRNGQEGRHSLCVCHDSANEDRGLKTGWHVHD